MGHKKTSDLNYWLKIALVILFLRISKNRQTKKYILN